MQEFIRFEQLIGIENIQKLKETTVLIVGLGGVGGYVVEALARSGIGKLILVDHDIIEFSNINRQLIALHSTIHQKKVEVWKERIENINPEITVITKDLFLTEENINEVVEQPIDYIVDACDTIRTKKEIIRTCIKNNIKLISCMGTGNKLDPTLLEILDIRKTNYDPIAKIIRKMVKDERIKQKIMVVCSKEPPKKQSEKTISSSAFVPGIAGLLLASYVVNDCVGVYENN